MPAVLRPQRPPARPLAGLAALLGLKPAAGRPGDGADPAGRTITGITHDSRQVQPGDLYAGLPGAQQHGARFAADAARAGAAGVLTDPAGRDLAAGCGLPMFVVTDPRARLGEVASWVYGHPSGRLALTGGTGTPGAAGRGARTRASRSRTDRGSGRRPATGRGRSPTSRAQTAEPGATAGACRCASGSPRR